MFTEFDLSTVYLFGASVGFLLVGIMGFAYLRLSTYAGFRPWVLSIACYSVGLLTYWLVSVRAFPFLVVIGNLCFVGNTKPGIAGHRPVFWQTHRQLARLGPRCCRVPCKRNPLTGRREPSRSPRPALRGDRRYSRNYISG